MTHIDSSGPSPIAAAIAARRFRNDGPCSFCHHLWEQHTGNDDSRHGCAAPQCPETPAPRIGRCAVYSSPIRAQATAEFFANAEKPVTLTAHQLADQIHRLRHGGKGGHSPFLSCSCLHEAMYLLGFPNPD